MQSQCKHINVCITHNMPTHKFECPEKILILDKGNYRELAQIYVNMQSYMNTYNMTYTHVDMCT